MRSQAPQHTVPYHNFQVVIQGSCCDPLCGKEEEKAKHTAHAILNTSFQGGPCHSVLYCHILYIQAKEDAADGKCQHPKGIF